MPELPDIEVYLASLAPLVLDRPLIRFTVRNPFVLRSVSPSPAEIAGAQVVGLRRMGKRIVLALEGNRFIVIHLMIAGRLRWYPASGKPPAKTALAGLEFGEGMLALTEAGTARRASIHLVEGAAGLEPFVRGGLEVLDADRAAFAERLVSENHTLKRALTDPRLFSGIGNAYSDEILHRAQLSPLTLTSKLRADEVTRLYGATREILTEWTRRLRAEVGDKFPDKVTAFREGMAVHGRFGQPCPVCGAKVQRIRYASNETNYCARCQTGGRLLADRAMSRLLHDDWPRSIDEVE